MMKNPAAFFLISCCFVFAAKAQEIKGVWAGEIESDDVFAAAGFDFDEAKIVLSFAGSERTGAIKNLKTTGDALSFDAELQPRARFVGAAANGKISGTFEMLRGDGTKSSAGVWKARKVERLSFKNETRPAATGEKLELPQPTGAFSVGRKFFYWTDESRAETLTDDPNDKRKLFVQIWYPAKSSGKKTAEYYPNFPEIYGDDKDRSAMRTTKTHAAQNAPVAASKTKFPVIVFSPGLGSSPFSYAAIIENLVSRGYAVAAVNHPYDSGDFIFSGGEIIRFAADKWNREAPKDWTADERKRFFDERRAGWARDISFVADRLEKLPDTLGKHLDLQTLGVLGHSFGGQALTIACASDRRFKACANLDGMAQGNVFLPDASGNVLKQPFLFFSKAAEVTDAELEMMNLTRAAYRTRERKRITTRWKPSFKKRLGELEAGAYFALYPGVKHSSFSDSLVLDTAPDDPLFAERVQIARHINDYIVQFFDKFLRGEKAPIYDDKTRAPSPVILEFLKTK